MLRQLENHLDLQISLYGDITAVQDCLRGMNKSVNERLGLYEGSALAAADKNARGVLRRGTESSLYLAVKSQLQQQAQASVSAGDTGALLACGKNLLGMLPGSHRPAICKFFPHPERPSYLLDLGATVDASAEQLLEFAQLADCLARARGDYEAHGPAISLLSNGVEAGKGNATVKKAAKLFDAEPGLNFQGFVEADQLFSGVTDIVVCDGFAGNIALKAAEGAAQRLFDFAELTSSVELPSAVLAQLRKRWAPQQLNGGLLLGIDGLLVKSHGGADSEAFASAIEEAYGLIRADLGNKLRETLLGPR